MRRALASLIGALVMLSAARASAAYHITKIVQVFAGSVAAPNAQYVQLQAYSAGQNFIGGHNIIFYNSAGTQIATLPLTDVANGSDQATVLIGTTSVQTALGVAPDISLPDGTIVQAGGKICFDAIDCFTWGNYSAGDNGTPFAALTADKAAKRTTSGGTNSTCLDSGDDTDNSAADFTAVTPAPKNNNAAAVACTTPPADAGTDASVNPGMDASTPPQDSGVSTIPTPPREGGTATSDSGTSSSSGGGGDDGGCSLGIHGSGGGWSTSLGLVAAAAILVASRRRRAKR